MARRRSNGTPDRDLGYVRRRARQDLFFAFSAQVTTSVLTLPAAILIARLAGPAGKGVLATVTTVANYAVLLTAIGLDTALVHFAARRLFTPSVLTRTGLIWSGTAGVAAYFASIAAYAVGFDSGGLLIWIAIALAQIPILLASSLLLAVMRGVGRIREASAVTAAGGAVRLLLAIIAVAFRAELPLLLIFNLLGVLGLGLGSWLVVRRAGLTRHVEGVRCSALPSLLRFGARVQVGGILQGFNYRLDLLLVAAMLGASSVGQYSTAVLVAEFLWIAPAVTGAVLQERIAAEPNAGRSLTPTAARITSFLLGCAVAALFLVSEPLVVLLFGPAFRPAAEAIRGLLPGIWALGLWKVLINDLIGRGFPGAQTLSAGAAAAATVLLDILLIPKHGIVGASLASSLAYMCALLVALSAYSRLVGVGARELLVPRLGDLFIFLLELRQMWGKTDGYSTGPPGSE